jgi:hypothetical protein
VFFFFFCFSFFFFFKGNLLVAETYSGIFRIDSKDLYAGALGPAPLANAHLVLSSSQIGAKFLNSLVEINRTLYFTDSDRNYVRRDVVSSLFDGRATGRLLKFQNKTVEVLLDGLSFANGVLQLDAETILVAETFAWRVISYNLQTGATRVFAELPCCPDNLSVVKGLIAVSCGGGWRVRALEVLQSIPFVRRLLLSVLTAKQILDMVPKRSAIVLLDKSGRIERTWQDPDARHGAEAISEAAQIGDSLFLGSWREGTTLLRMSLSSLHLWTEETKA